jgi:hypothetical protein
VPIAVILFLAALLPAPSASPAPTLDDLVARHTTSMGGAAAIEATQDVVATLSWKEAELTAEVTAAYSRDGRVRIDAILADGTQVTETFDGAQGWSRGRSGAVVSLSAEGAAALRRALELPGWIFGVHELSGRGHQLSLAPPIVLDGVRHEVIELELDDGFRSDLIVDPETLRVVARREQRALHPDVDPAKHLIENRFSDFRSDGGVLRPYRSETIDLTTGTRLMVIEVRSVRVNSGLPRTLFRRPAI